MTITPKMIGSHRLHFIGLGNIGSKIFLQMFRTLVCQGWKGTIVLWDDDVVEERNRYNQEVFERHSINPEALDPSARRMGMPKVRVAAELAREIQKESGITIIEEMRRVTKDTELDGYVFSSVDRMKQRKAFWPAIKKDKDKDSKVAYLIEMRIGMTGGRIYGIDPNNTYHIFMYENKDNFVDDPPGLENVCKTEFPRPSVGHMAASFGYELLLAWLRLGQGSSDPVPNYWEFNFNRQYFGCEAPWISVNYYTDDPPRLP